MLNGRRGHLRIILDIFADREDETRCSLKPLTSTTVVLNTDTGQVRLKPPDDLDQEHLRLQAMAILAKIHHQTLRISIGFLDCPMHSPNITLHHTITKLAQRECERRTYPRRMSAIVFLAAISQYLLRARFHPHPA